MGQVISINKFKKMKFKKVKTVLVGGSFDLLNVGHIRFLKKCKKLGDILIVGLTSDEDVKKRKGSLRPIISQRQRGDVLAALEMVDYVFISKLSAYNDKNIRAIHPDIIAIPLEKGKFNKRRKFKKEIKSKFPHIKVELIYSPSRISTTKIIEKILKSYSPKKQK